MKGRQQIQRKTVFQTTCCMSVKIRVFSRGIPSYHVLSAQIMCIKQIYGQVSITIPSINRFDRHLIDI